MYVCISCVLNEILGFYPLSRLRKRRNLLKRMDGKFGDRIGHELDYCMSTAYDNISNTLFVNGNVRFLCHQFETEANAKFHYETTVCNELLCVLCMLHHNM